MPNYDENGNGPAAILVHGMVVSRRDWRLVSPALAEAGFRALAVDLPGHGDSPKPDDPAAYSVEALLSALGGWIDQLAPGQPVCLAGHSLGGFLCLEYCLRHPGRVDRLALVDPFCYPEQLAPALRYLARRPGLAQRVKRQAPGWLVKWLLRWDRRVLAGVPPADRLQIATDLKQTSPHVLNLLSDLPDLRPRLGALQTPALLIWGERDTLLRPDSFPRLAAHIPHAESLCLRRARHLPQLSHPAEVGEALARFFRRE